MGVGQVFVFIVAAITFALIAIFGFKAIVSFMDSGEQVQFVQFKNDLEGSIKKIYTEYGSVRKEDFNPGSEFTKICFINLDYEGYDQDQLDRLCAENQIACDAWKTAQDEKGSNTAYDTIDQNVFLTPQVSIPIKVHQISLLDKDDQPTGFLCQTITRGSFSIILEGKGDHTEVSPYLPHEN
ncbi:hypothetical protein HYV86_05475 [Candidatus Woesearchaeota archaeon]|nr:hypothetical protein [Candidatus Woesearchaeota archaeon]